MSHLNFWRSSHCVKWLFDATEVLKQEQLLAKQWNLNLNQLNELFTYLTKFIFLVCNDCGYDYHIAGMAAILFRRIYQKYLSMKNLNHFNDDPRLIAVVCIFITAKSKDCNISTTIAFLAKIKCHDPLFKYNQDDVIKSESNIMNILSFDLNIFLPFEACTDLLASCNRLDILREVWQLLLITFKSNIYLLYPPYLIAMACIYITCNLNETIADFEVFLAKIHIPFDNISEVTKVIIQQIFVREKEKNMNESNKNKKQNHIPVAILKHIDSIYSSKYKK